jgi:hypothetical protein
VTHDAVALYFIQNLPHFRRRPFSVVQKGNEIRDCTLEIYVVLPQRVVGVDQKRL